MTSYDKSKINCSKNVVKIMIAAMICHAMISPNEARIIFERYD